MKTLRLLLLAILCIAGCSSHDGSDPDDDDRERGDVIEAESLGNVPVAAIAALLDQAGVDWPYPLNNGVEPINVVYQTMDADGELVEASGVLIFPDQGTSWPLVSLQHGTVLHREEVASQNLMQTLEGALGVLMASMGYAVCLPDYPGFGVSEIIHPYLHAKSLALSVVDLISAFEKYGGLEGYQMASLFLAGYSEGGYVTLAAQKEIELQGPFDLEITAVAPMAGPYDLIGTMRMLFEEGLDAPPLYPCFALTAYNDVYDWNRLSDFFQSPYAGMMEDLFGGAYSYDEVSLELPETVGEVLKPAFISGIVDETEVQVLHALQENTLISWSPQAPIRFFHGDADEVVPYQNAIIARDSLIAYGAAQVELVTIPGGTHTGSGLAAFLGMIDWFGSFSGIPKSKHVRPVNPYTGVELNRLLGLDLFRK